MGPKYQVGALPIPGVDEPQITGDYHCHKRGKHNAPIITGEIEERGDDETIEKLSLVNEMSSKEGAWEIPVRIWEVCIVDSCLFPISGSM